MELHKLLTRQLERLHLSEASLPTDLAMWQEFIKRVNNVYVEADQERYMLERSMEVSSRELQELNSRLENAQQIAHLGYWSYDRPANKVVLSKILYTSLGYDISNSIFTREQFLEIIHEQDRLQYRKLVDKAFSENESYEYEMRIQTVTGTYNWYYIIAHPVITNNQPPTQITGIAMDVSTRKAAEESIATLNQRLLTSARRAGMADVATSILHNVGNVLNSTNVSIGLIQENAEQSHLEKLLFAINLIKENVPTAPDYLTHDPKGKLIPEYLIALAEFIKTEQKTLNQEIANLNTHIQHIKEIVAMQRSVGGVSGIDEKVFLPEIVNLALQMSGAPFEAEKITLNTQFDETQAILIDKAKLLQILVNLIQNARDALVMHEQEKPKQITIAINKKTDKEVILSVVDNGGGIAPENLNKIFSMGFTTKPHGHGFGLHSSALVAKEIKGKLEAKSAGVGQGAAFVLTLDATPYQPGMPH